MKVRLAVVLATAVLALAPAVSQAAGPKHKTFGHSNIWTVGAHVAHRPGQAHKTVRLHF